MSISIKYWLTGNVEDSYIDWVINHFADRSYYWMFPCCWCLKRMFDNHIKKLKEDKSFPKEVLEIKKVLDV